MLFVTKESRQFISLDEIVSIQFRCVKQDCRATVSLPSNAWEKLPVSCPSCNEPWWFQERPVQSDSTEKAIQYLQRSIRKLVDLHRDRKDLKGRFFLGCDIGLEISASD